MYVVEVVSDECFSVHVFYCFEELFSFEPGATLLIPGMHYNLKLLYISLVTHSYISVNSMVPP